MAVILDGNSEQVAREGTQVSVENNFIFATPVPETLKSDLVNFELWLNLTENLTENRNR